MGTRCLEKVKRPFLRWAGGKSWLYRLLDQNNLPDFNNYHEPFLGGGAVFFKIGTERNAFLSDLNNDLITTYSQLKDNVSEVLEILSTYENSKEFYYRLRSDKPKNDSEIASRFIYLNQTSFNGIYRVNLKGDYNVPFGYRKKHFLEESLLLNVSAALQNSTIEVGDFEIVRKNLKKNDLVFLDPPYTVSHNNNGFIKYNEKLFSLDDQYRLDDLIKYIKQLGAYYILTNAAHKKIKEIFINADNQQEISRPSLIGGSNAFRGQTTEFIYSNIELDQN